MPDRENREEANHWIELTHTGENDGAGVVRWGSDEASRFRARSGKVGIETQALDFLERRGELTLEDRRNVPATSLRRILNAAPVRAKLGFDFENGEINFQDERQFAKALLLIVKRLITGEIKTAHIYDKQHRASFAEKLPREVLFVPKDRSKPATTRETKSRAAAVAPPTRAKPRDNLIPADCVLKIDAVRIRYIEIELRTLSLDLYSNAISVLFRVFLELSVDAYLQKRSLSVVGDSLGKKMSGVLADLLAQRKLTREQAVPVRRACQKDSLLAPSVTLMHQYVHNQHIFPAPADLRAQWDSLQPFLIAIWSP